MPLHFHGDTNMTEALRNYLWSAYVQDHPTDVPTWIAQLEELCGEGELLELHKLMAAKYGVPEIGTSRAAYMSKTVVFKVPTTLDGFRNNDWEASLISIPDTPIARSRHLPKCDIPVVVMERVQPCIDLQECIDVLGTVPDFVSAVDMAQVGWTRKGRLVAYDYADL